MRRMERRLMEQRGQRWMVAAQLQLARWMVVARRACVDTRLPKPRPSKAWVMSVE